MSDITIRVDSLSKLCHIGARSDPQATLRDRLALPPYRKGIVLAVLISGAAYLNRTEQTFADGV